MSDARDARESAALSAAEPGSHRFAGDYFMRRVGQVDPHLVRAGLQADHDHRFAAGVDEVPPRSSTVTWTWPSRGDLSPPLPNTGATLRFSVRYWMYTPPGQRLGEWWVDDQPGRWLVLDGDQRRRAANVPGARDGCDGGEQSAGNHDG